MSDSKPGIYCIIHNCNISSSNKPSYVNLHPLPTTNEMRNKWLQILKNRCSTIDWSRGRICSNHFESKYFDSQRQLWSNAIPTKFPVQRNIVQKPRLESRQLEQPNLVKTKLDRLLNNVSLPTLQEDVKNSIQDIKMPENLSYLINDNLQCPPNASTEIHLYWLVKKQEHLIKQLTHENIQTKKQLEVLRKNMEESKSEKKKIEQSLEHHKYIAKCLQEKHATLEEQIEILTAVEAR